MVSASVEKDTIKSQIGTQTENNFMLNTLRHDWPQKSQTSKDRLELQFIHFAEITNISIPHSESKTKQLCPTLTKTVHEGDLPFLYTFRAVKHILKGWAAWGMQGVMVGGLICENNK